MKRKAINSFILATSVLFLTACGSNSKSNTEDGPRGTTTLSIVYDSTSNNDAGKIVGHYHVHAVDAQGKPMTNLALNLSIVNGVKEIRNQKLQNATGTIESSAPIGFYDAGVNFSQTGVGVGDSLIIVPSSGKTGIEYLGDWKITAVAAGLTLRENSFHLESTSGLTYVIGNEERFLGGTSGRGEIAVAHIESVENNTTDDNGFTYFDIVFDPTLAGHTVTVGVHTDGNRIGIGKVIGLRAAEFFGGPVTVPNSGGIQYVTMTLGIDPGNGGTEHLIGVNIVPSSFSVEPAKDCSLNYDASDFHTDGGGSVLLAINTGGSGNSTTTDEATVCTIEWAGGITSIYLEY